MRILVSIAQIPFILWLLVAGGLAYMDYNQWHTEVYEPLVAQSQAKSGELDQLKAANRRAQEFDAQRSAKLKELQDLGDQFKESANKIPRTASISALLKSFADVSDSIGIEIGSYKPLEEKSDAFVQISPIEVGMIGTYPQIMSFLDAVANLERIVHSKTIAFSNPLRRGNSSRLSAKVTFETYSISQASIEQESQGTVAPKPKVDENGNEVPSEAAAPESGDG